MNILHIGEEILKFLVYGVGIGFIGRKLVADFLIRKGKALINSSERNAAIWQHYQRQAIGRGHNAASVMDCSEEKCQVFGQMPMTA